MKIALFHPWLKSKGGSERVVLEFLENTKHQVDIYTWIYDEQNTFDEFRKFEIKVVAPKFVQKISRTRVLRGFFLPISIFSKISLRKYDKFLISTSGVAEFITFRNYKKGQTYAYCHTPLREANKKIVEWNLENIYKNKFLNKQTYFFAVKIYKIFEKIAWKKLDVVIFNSELSLSRAHDNKLLKKQKTHIICPPFNSLDFKRIKTKQEKTFIYISRFNPPKRQDLLLEAWKKFVKEKQKYKLILIGSIENKRYFEKLKKLQKETKNVEIKINVSDKELKKFLANSYAGLFFGYQEDFGMVPLEIILAKKPLIAVDEGGYVQLIKDHYLFHKVKEKHNREEMIKEINKELENFVKKKRVVKKKGKIKIQNFAEEIDKILGW